MEYKGRVKSEINGPHFFDFGEVHVYVQPVDVSSPPGVGTVIFGSAGLYHNKTLAAVVGAEYSDYGWPEGFWATEYTQKEIADYLEQISKEKIFGTIPEQTLIQKLRKNDVRHFDSPDYLFSSYPTEEIRCYNSK